MRSRSFTIFFLLASLLFWLGPISCESSESGSRRVNPALVLSEQEVAELPSLTTGPAAFKFGFDLRNTPEEDARQYLPFLRYLSQATGLAFELRFTPRGHSLAEELAAGRVDFAAIGGLSLLAAQRQGLVTPLAQGKNGAGKTSYQAAIIVTPASKLQRITDLRGQRLALGDRNSTQGHLIPLIILHEHGLSLADLAAHSYTGSHAACAEAVLADRADACGLQDVMARRLADQGLARIIHWSKEFPASGIAAHAGLEAAVIARVRQALLDFAPQGRDADGLYRWEQTEMAGGFAPVVPEDYLELARWVDFFGLLAPPDTTGEGRP